MGPVALLLGVLAFVLVDKLFLDQKRNFLRQWHWSMSGDQVDARFPKRADVEREYQRIMRG